MDKRPEFAMSIGRRLKETGRSQTELARFLNVDPSIVNKMINGRRGISAEEYHRISLYLSDEATSPGDLLEVRPTITTAFLVGTVEAGAFREVDGLEDTQFDDERTLPVAVDPRFPNARLLMFNVAGDSMDELKPRPILPGDQILAVSYEDVAHQIPLRDGMVVVVQRSRDGGQTREWSVKQVELHDDHVGFCPRSSSPRHKPIVVQRDLQADEGVTVEVIAVVRQVLNQVPLG